MPRFAQTAAPRGRRGCAAAPVPNKGDTAWMLISSALVLMMSIPGLALFYGGLVRTKNMALHPDPGVRHRLAWSAWSGRSTATRWPSATAAA